MTGTICVFQFSHQALGIRRFDKSNNAHKRVPTSNMNLLSPPGGKPEATSPTGGTNASTYKHNNQMVFMSRRQAGGGSSGHHPRSKSESKADQKPRAEAVFNRCYQRGEIGKSNGGRISSQSKIFAMRQASPHCEGRLGEDLAGLSQSLEEFEREYTEMCQTQAKGSKNGALNDSDDFATASLVDSCSERKANDVRDIEFRVPSCQSPTEQGVHCRSPNVIDGNVTDNKLTYEQSLPADSEVCQSYPGHGTAADDEMENEKSEIDKLSKEDIDDELSERKIVEESKNPDKTNKDKMVSEGKEKSIALSADDICDKALNQDLENLSLRECNIRDSLLSLDSLNTSEGTTDHESQAFHPFECHSESRKEGMADLMSEDLENVESCGDSSTESDPEMLTAEVKRHPEFVKPCEEHRDSVALYQACNMDKHVLVDTNKENKENSFLAFHPHPVRCMLNCPFCPLSVQTDYIGLITSRARFINLFDFVLYISLICMPIASWLMCIYLVLWLIFDLTCMML